jgi:hypothetical protein
LVHCSNAINWDYQLGGCSEGQCHWGRLEEVQWSELGGLPKSQSAIVNAGEPDHIFAGKFKQFSPSDIMKMMGIMLIDGLSPSPQLTSR